MCFEQLNHLFFNVVTHRAKDVHDLFLCTFGFGRVGKAVVCAFSFPKSDGTLLSRRITNGHYEIEIHIPEFIHPLRTTRVLDPDF
jgi:hypothetical protein